MNTARKKKKSASDQFTNQVLKDVNKIRAETSVTKSFDVLRSLETEVKSDLDRVAAMPDEGGEDPTTIAGSSEADAMWGELRGQKKSSAQPPSPQNKDKSFNSKSNATVTEMDFSNLRRGSKGSSGSKASTVTPPPSKPAPKMKSPPPPSEPSFKEGFGDPTEVFSAAAETKAYSPKALDLVDMESEVENIVEYPENDEATEMIEVANDHSQSKSENMWANSGANEIDYNPPSVNFGGEDKTIAIGSSNPYSPSPQDSGGDERTIAVESLASRKGNSEPKTTVGFGQVNYGFRTGGSVYTSGDASLIQAENLKIAQSHIQDLESEVDKLRKENEELASAGEVIQKRCDELQSRANEVERQKSMSDEQHQAEQVVLRDNLSYKEQHIKELQKKVEELDHRLKQDFRKIRVRERELENRLEIAKQERSALAKAKDDVILELKRKLDLLQIEVESYREKTLDLNRQITSNEEQFKRTVRALRLALTNLEVSDEGKVIKKAE